MTSPIHRLVTALVLLVAICTSVQAQPAPPPSDAARAHFEQGQALTANGDYAGAYREFEAGYQANPRPAFLFNMGEAARAMGDVVKARAAYERFLVVEPTGALATTAHQRLAELGPAPQPVATPTPVPPPQPKVPPPHEVAATIDATSTSRMTLVAGPSATSESRPLWKKWPVWAAIGGAVVAAVVIGVAVKRHGDMPCDVDCIDYR